MAITLKYYGFCVITTWRPCITLHYPIKSIPPIALCDFQISKVSVTISLITSYPSYHLSHYVTFESQKFGSLFFLISHYFLYHYQSCSMHFPFHTPHSSLEVPLWPLNLKCWVTSLHIIWPPSIIFLCYFYFVLILSITFHHFHFIFISFYILFIYSYIYPISSLSFYIISYSFH